MTPTHRDYLLNRLAGVAKSGRWTPRRKQDLLELIAAKELSFTTAAHRFGIPEEEIRHWLRRFEAHGARGLFVGDVPQETRR